MNGHQRGRASLEACPAVQCTARPAPQRDGERSAGAIFVCIPEWTGPFDIEIDCIAMV
jgi:hypothetical protein